MRPHCSQLQYMSELGRYFELKEYSMAEETSLRTGDSKKLDAFVFWLVQCCLRRPADQVADERVLDTSGRRLLLALAVTSARQEVSRVKY